MKARRIPLCCCAALFAFLCAVILFLVGLVSADAQSADKIITDFSNSNTAGWTLNENAFPSSEGVQVMPSGEVVSQDSMRNFLLQIEFGTLQKGFELTFGSQENICSIRFDGAYLRLSGLRTNAGSEVFTMDNVLTENAIVQIEIIAGEVSVSVKQEGEPYDVLSTAIAKFTYAEGVITSEGNIKLSAYDGAVFSVRKIHIYSLNSTVEIETEDYVAPAENEIGNTNSNKGCNSYLGSSVSTGAFVGLTLAAVVVVVICGGKKNEKRR